MTTSAPLAVDARPSPRARLLRVVLRLLADALLWLIIELSGVDVRGWLETLWDQIRAIPFRYVAAALVFQTGQTYFAGLAYYGIFRAAYSGEVPFWPII